jgi:putative Holliday junction resolvase
VREYDALEVVVGLPRTMRGDEGSAADAARRYATAIARRVAPVGVRLVDERLSTVSAHRTLRDAGVRGRRHRPVVDQVAAVVILQSALDAERASGRAPGTLVVPEQRSESPAARDEEGGEG